ncbi:hypothetical protein B0T20DRAFT_115478 [Sordaria brevicollis]|uniref:Uncharacterized protein n=1 Tax=Sordaria brevicollis TaxID=83679 RepID=A0AAE0PK27_SORBR|nr:hypothetical protein B0T20DRAFT_115478 [Sordaria brevicollis]
MSSSTSSTSTSPTSHIRTGCRALYTFTERPPIGSNSNTNTNNQHRWYFGISYHPSDGRTPYLNNPIHPYHAWMIFEYIVVHDPLTSQQPLPPPQSFAIYRPINDHLQANPANLNILRSSSVNPPPLGTTTLLLQTQWKARFHPLCHLADDDWDFVDGALIRPFLAGKNMFLGKDPDMLDVDVVIEDGQDFVKIVLAEQLREEGILGGSDYEGWWRDVRVWYKDYEKREKTREGEEVCSRPCHLIAPGEKEHENGVETREQPRVEGGSVEVASFRAARDGEGETGTQ